MPKKKVSFEEALANLEKYADQLRSGKLTLEESVKVYEKSAECYELCRTLLDEAKQRIEIFRPETGELEDFEDGQQ